MSRREPRRFEALDPMEILRPEPLYIGLYGKQGRGKSESGLRIAIGIARLYGVPINFVDAEQRSVDLCRRYKRQFPDLRYVPFPPPHNAYDFMDLLKHYMQHPCILMIDGMSEEHAGTDGLLETKERHMVNKRGEYQEGRAPVAWGKAKPPHDALARLVRAFIQINPMICCWRAKDKLDWGHKDDRGNTTPLALGAMPIGSDDLPFECTATYLMREDSAKRGVPVLDPKSPGEIIMSKFPDQFEGVIEPGEQLCERHGDAFARWALGVNLVLGQIRAARSCDELPATAGIKARFPDERHPARLLLENAWKQAYKDLRDKAPPSPPKADEPAERQPGEN